VEQCRRIKVHTPGQLVGLVPGLLGFQPSDSLVAVILRRGRVKLTARWDLAPADHPAMARRLCHGPGRLVEPGDEVCLIGYGRRGPIEVGLAAVRQELGDVVRQGLIVDGDRWWYDDEPASAPGQLRPPPAQSMAHLVSRGAVAASRQELADSIAPPTGQREDDLMAELVGIIEQTTEDQPVAEAERAMAAIDRFVAGQTLSDADFLSAGVAMTSGLGRDVLWRQLTRDNAGDQEPFWREVARRTPSGLRAIPLAVTGLVAWVAGHGAMMNICLDEAATADPDHPLIGLLAQIAEGGVPPTWWDGIQASLSGRPAAAARPGG